MSVAKSAEFSRWTRNCLYRRRAVPVCSASERGPRRGHSRFLGGPKVMKTELQEAMTSGVYVEFRDAAGNTIGQVLYTDWRGRPVPAVGDALACNVPSSSGSDPAKLLGRIISRQFELQHEVDGSPCVWVRLIVETKVGTRRSSSSAPGDQFLRELIVGCGISVSTVASCQSSDGISVGRHMNPVAAPPIKPPRCAKFAMCGTKKPVTNW